MSGSSTDRIEKRIELKAPLARVWRAVSDYREFGQWFRVALEEPFVPGETTKGRITYPGYEHMEMNVVVEKMEPERLLSFRWYPTEDFPSAANDPPTLVEFQLQELPGGTLLVLTESGFDAIPPERREEAYRRTEGGWTEQMKNIETYVSNVTNNP